jgi:hypothetical protein
LITNQQLASEEYPKIKLIYDVMAAAPAFPMSTIKVRPFGKTWGTRGFEGEPGRNEWNEASPDSFTTRRPFSRHRIRSTCFNVALFQAHTGKTDNPNINLIKGVEKIVLNSVTQGRLTQERYRDCSPGTRRCQKFWGHAHSAARKCV